MNTGIINNLAALRKQRGIAASDLANMVSVTRQTIYALEAGSYMPNAALGLRLARALNVGFEELFTLAEPGSPSEDVTLLPLMRPLDAGQSVQLCRVDGKLFGVPVAPAGDYLPASDATIAARPRVNHKAKVHLHDGNDKFANRLLLAGCDPAMSVLARYLQPFGVDLLLLHRNSSESLALLKRGHVHIAGTHLQSNLEAVGKLFSNSEVAVVSFAVWEEGLLTSASNPKNIRGVQDLPRKGVTFVNREPGSGSRRHLDNLLRQMKIDSKSVRGYTRAVPGHLAAASEVNSGVADCCIATESAARLFGLHFIPLESVRFDFVVHKRHLDIPQIQIMFDALSRSPLRRKLESIGGYQTQVTGERLI